MSDLKERVGLKGHVRKVAVRRLGEAAEGAVVTGRTIQKWGQLDNLSPGPNFTHLKWIYLRISDVFYKCNMIFKKVMIQ